MILEIEKRWKTADAAERKATHERGFSLLPNLSTLPFALCQFFGLACLARHATSGVAARSAIGFRRLLFSLRDRLGVGALEQNAIKVSPLQQLLSPELGAKREEPLS